MNGYLRGLEQKKSNDGQDQDKGGHCPTSPPSNDATGADQNLLGMMIFDQYLFLSLSIFYFTIMPSFQ